MSDIGIEVIKAKATSIMKYLEEHAPRNEPFTVRVVDARGDDQAEGAMDEVRRTVVWTDRHGDEPLPLAHLTRMFARLARQESYRGLPPSVLNQHKPTTNPSPALTGAAICIGVRHKPGQRLEVIGAMAIIGLPDGVALRLLRGAVAAAGCVTRRRVTDSSGV